MKGKLLNNKAIAPVAENIPHVKWFDLAVIFIREDGSIVTEGDPMEMFMRCIYSDDEPEIIDVNGMLNMPAELQMYAIREPFDIFRPGILKEFAEHLEDDLYLIPSSIHEFLVVPVGNGEGKDEAVLTMIRDINNTHVASNERLSYNLYKYHRDTGEITMLEGDVKL